MKSIFSDKKLVPASDDLKEALQDSYDFWKQLEDFTKSSYPDAKEEWHFSGEKFGWSFRISDKKRVLLYLLPRKKFFKAALVFGPKAVEQILGSNISDNIKTELIAAKSHAEGRGIRIDVFDKSKLEDIQKLIRFKIMN